MPLAPKLSLEFHRDLNLSKFICSIRLEAELMEQNVCSEYLLYQSALPICQLFSGGCFFKTPSLVYIVYPTWYNWVSKVKAAL